MEGQGDFRAQIVNHPLSYSNDRSPGAALPKVSADPFPKLTFFLIELWVTIHNLFFVDDEIVAHLLCPVLDTVKKLTRPVVSKFFLVPL